MAEFKFSCPQCHQRIQCDAGYAGTQITCPACRQAIVVPQAPATAATPAVPPPVPPSVPAASKPSLAPSGLATRQSTAAPAAGQRFSGAPGAGAPPPKAKSKALRNTLIIAASIIVLAGLGAGGWFGYSAIKAHKLKGNPAAQVATPSTAATLQALSLLGKVHSAYTNLTSLNANGTITLFLDLSNVTMGDIDPGRAKDAKMAARRPPGMPKVLTNTTEVTVKRAGSNQYYFAGEAITKMDRNTLTNTFAFWSSDKGRFTFTDQHQKGRAFYQQLPDPGPNDSQQAAMKNIQHFFEDPAQLAKIIKDLGQTDDEFVNGDSCYTLTAKVLGQKVKIWVNKTSYLISQWQITLGGQITDADIDDVFDAVSTATSMPHAQVDMAKPQMKKMAPVMAKIRGTVTSTSRNIEINPTLTSDDFDYAVPAGVRLIPFQNGAAKGKGKPVKGASPTTTKTAADTTTTTPSSPAPAAGDANSRNACINNLRQIDGAKNEWALEKGKPDGAAITEEDIKPYLKLDADGNLPKCPDGGKYTIGKVGQPPTCSIAGHELPK